MAAYKRINLAGKALGDKMHVAFALMSIVPLLVMAYIVTVYVFPELEHSINMTGITIIVLFAVWAAYSGYLLAKEIILPVINLTLETKIISSKYFSKDTFIDNNGAIGDIEEAVSNMTGQIRGYMGELQEYNKKTTSLNAHIHKKVVTLTSLMKIGDMITSGRAFNDILKFSAQKMAEGAYGSFCGIFMKEETGRYTIKAFCDRSGMNIKCEDLAVELSSVEKMLYRKGYLILNPSETANERTFSISKKGHRNNAIFVPMKMNKEIIGMVMLGNPGDDIEFDTEDMKVLKAFTKELVLAYQSSRIGDKVNSVEIIDSVTGLYSFVYLKDRLEEEINRSIYYQRPCSLIVVKLDKFELYMKEEETSRVDYLLKRISRIMSDIIPPVGKLSRSGEYEFSLLLPEKNKRESMEMAELISRKITDMKIPDNPEEKITVGIGVGENPIDGATADEIIERARKYADKASLSGENNVVGWD